jgi:hypothetical protein
VAASSGRFLQGGVPGFASRTVKKTVIPALDAEKLSIRIRVCLQAYRKSLKKWFGLKPLGFDVSW